MITTIKKIISLISSQHKKVCFVLIFLMFIGMFLETLSIGLIIPLFNIITDPNFIVQYPATTIFLAKVFPANWFLDSSQFEISHDQLIISAIIIMLLVYLFKSCFVVYISWRQADFIKELNKHWSNKLYLGYLKLPYSFYLKTNSAYLLRNIFHTSIVVNAIDSALILLTEILVITGIFLLLLITKPIEGLTIIILLSLSSYVVHHYTKNYLTAWGVRRHFHDGERQKHVLQGFNAVKDLKMLGAEKNFADKYIFHHEASLKVTRNGVVVQSFKRSWLEMVVAISMSALLLVMMMVTQYDSYVNMIPTLGLFAAAAFRLMPSASRILFAAHRLRIDLPSINVIYHDLTKTIKQETFLDQSNTMPFNKVIEVDKVNFVYEGRAKSTLSNINLKIQKGSQVGLIGESGSGKSTLINVVIGLLEPSEGYVKVDTNDIQHDVKSWIKQIGYVSQNIYLTDDTIRNNVAFGLKDDEIDENAVKEAIAGADLEKFINNLPEGLDTFVGDKGVRISEGQKQRVCIARALYRKPTVLVFDEATSSLDVETEKNIMSGINKFKGSKTIIIVSHRLSAVSNCDQLFRLDKGKIIKTESSKEVFNNKL